MSVDVARRTALCETRGKAIKREVREETKLISTDNFQISSVDSDPFGAKLSSALQRNLPSPKSSVVHRLVRTHQLHGPLVCHAHSSFLFSSFSSVVLRLTHLISSFVFYQTDLDMPPEASRPSTLDQAQGHVVPPPASTANSAPMATAPNSVPTDFHIEVAGVPAVTGQSKETSIFQPTVSRSVQEVASAATLATPAVPVPSSPTPSSTQPSPLYSSAVGRPQIGRNDPSSSSAVRIWPPYACQLTKRPAISPSSSIDAFRFRMFRFSFQVSVARLLR